MLVTGAATVYAVLLPRAARLSRRTALQHAGAATGADSAGDTDELHRRYAAQAARLGMLACAALLLVWALRLAVQVMEFRDPFEPLVNDVQFLLGATTWGNVWIAQGALLCWLGAGFLLAAGRRGLGRMGIALMLGVAALALTNAMSSHAMAGQQWRALGVAADMLHGLAAGAWLGSLAVVVVLRGSREGFATLLHVFSPLAQASVAVLLAAGVALSVYHLPSVDALWSTTYGRLLLAKTGVALCVMAAGYLNWRRGLPALAAGGAAGVRRRIAFELGCAALVLAITAVLAGTGMEGHH